MNNRRPAGRRPRLSRNLRDFAFGIARRLTPSVDRARAPFRFPAFNTRAVLLPESFRGGCSFGAAGLSPTVSPASRVTAKRHPPSGATIDGGPVQSIESLSVDVFYFFRPPRARTGSPGKGPALRGGRSSS